MDFNSDQSFRQSPVQQPKGSGMMTAAYVLSIIAVATICCLYSALICGSLSIILAYLSRGAQKNLNSKGRMCVIMSTIAIIASTIFIGFTLWFTIKQYGSLDNFLQYYQSTVNALGATSFQ